jgi:RimJ/RimL family protein N-acetyltransferase
MANDHGRRVTLGAVRAEDLPRLWEWINDREQVIYNAAYKPVSEPEHLAWFEQVSRNPRVKIFALRDAADDVLVGTCQLHSIDCVARAAELQIRIGDVGKRDAGLGTDAVRQLTEFGFRDLNLNRIYLHVFATNARAIHVYEKAGFVREGLLRQAAFLDGAFVDVVVMAMLRGDHAAS